MANRALAEEINFVADLQNLVSAYEEIAVLRIQRTRASVISTRAFVAEMKKVMVDVRLSYRRAFFLKKKTKSKNTKNTRPLAVFIAADNRLSGSLITDIFRDFLRHTQENDCDILIIGKIGTQLFKSSSPQKQFASFDFPDQMLDEGLLTKIFAYVNNYTDVRVFYGKLTNLMHQEAIQEHLGITAEPLDDNQPKGIVPFIFEPNLEVVSVFFDTEIMASLLSQTVHEGQLAIWGSRVKAMEETSQRIEKKITSLERVESVERHREISKKQRQTLAGRALWEQ